MNKTIYVRDEDVSIWDRAKELAGEKLAPIIMQGLRRFITQKEREQQGFERLEIQFRDSNENELPKAKAFFGRWLYDRESPLRRTNYDAFGDNVGDEVFAVAITAKGRFAILSWHEYQGSQYGTKFKVYEDIDEMKRFNLNNQAIADIVEKLGVEVEELDI